MKIRDVLKEKQPQEFKVLNIKNSSEEYRGDFNSIKIVTVSIFVMGILLKK